MAIKVQQIEAVRADAAGYFGNGFHCAEAVARAVGRAAGEDPSGITAHATAFGGGFGKTHDEACGALSGGLIVIGHFFGRSGPGMDWELPALLGAELRDKFIKTWGTTHCQTLCKTFGHEAQEAGCREVVRATAGHLFELLLDQGVEFIGEQELT